MEAVSAALSVPPTDDAFEDGALAGLGARSSPSWLCFRFKGFEAGTFGVSIMSVPHYGRAQGHG
jgi:hypothetical protein